MIPAMVQVGFALRNHRHPGVDLRVADHVPGAPDAILAVVWLGLLGSGAAYLVFFRLLGKWGATRTSLVAYLLPVVGIALGVLVVGETVDLRIIAGTALIIGGVTLVNARTRRRVGHATESAATVRAEPA